MSPAVKKPEASGQIELVRLERSTIVVPLQGSSPYIPHRYTEKARKQMRDKQASSSRVKAQREPRDPEREAFEGTYWIVPGEQPGAPAAAFAQAMHSAVRSFDGITLVAAKSMFLVHGQGPEQLVPLLDAEWEMREDMVRVGSGMNKVADFRYRNYVYPWRADLKIDFKPQLISATSIIALVEEGGSLGIGDWRPGKTAGGLYGQWALDLEREVQVL